MIGRVLQAWLARTFGAESIYPEAGAHAIAGAIRDSMSDRLCKRCHRGILTADAGPLCMPCGERLADLRHDDAQGWNATERDIDAGLVM